MEKLQRCVPDKTAGPGGEEAELSTNIQGGKYTLELEQTRILVYLGEPLPYAVAQEIYLDMIRQREATSMQGSGQSGWNR
mgnify:FL=1